MKAVRVHGPGDLRVDDVARPRCGFGAVLLEVEAVGICTTDQKITARGAANGHPRTLGHEIVGHVAETGECVDRYRVGDRVVVAPNIGCGSCRWCLQGEPQRCPDFQALGIHLDGGMAEAVVVPHEAVARGHLIRLPDALPTEVAALTEPVACVLESLLACRLQGGETVLVVGGGVMGRLHASAARALGAGTIVLSDPHRTRLEHARRLGADVTVRARSENLREVVHAATGGRGVDVAAVTVGSIDALQEAASLLARGGRLNAFAGVSAEQGTLPVSVNDLHYSYQTLLGTTGASLRTLQRTVELLAAGRLNVAGMVSATYPLARAVEAFHAAGSTEHARVLLRPDGTRSAGAAA